MHKRLGGNWKRRGMDRTRRWDAQLSEPPWTFKIGVFLVAKWSGMT